MKLPLGDVRLDGGTQPRDSLNKDCVKRYEQDMLDGVQYDPIEVVYDGADYWCWDGFHRCNAARLAHLQEIDANVTQGTLADAQWLCASANKRHGVPRSNEDKARAVRTALTHPKGLELSDSAIAEHVGVSQPFVGKVRKALAATYNDYKSTTRTGRDGRTIKTGNIGKNPESKKTRKAANHGVRISHDAAAPVLGHSLPNPMIALNLPPNNPVMAAATIFKLFDSTFVRALIAELTKRLKGGF